MHTFTDIAGRTLILSGLFALAVQAMATGKRYPRRSWQRASCQLAVGLLTAAALMTLATH